MRYAVTLAVLLLLTSCGTATGPGGGAEDVDGRTFLSTQASEDGVPRDLVEGSRISITFEGGQLSAQAGCNTMLGGYEVDGNTLVVDGLAMTEMGCPEDLMAQDAWLAALLESGPALAVDGDTLILTGGSTVLTLQDREVADPDRPLTGTVWRVDSLISGDAVSTVPGEAEATLTFAEDGTVEVRGGCNQGSGEYTLEDDGGTVDVGPVAMTLMACEGERGELEDHVLTVLNAGELTVQIVADRLTLSAGEVGLGLTAED